MCGCQAHYALVDCTCDCDHTHDLIRLWKERALEAESQLEVVKSLAKDMWVEWEKTEYVLYTERGITNYERTKLMEEARVRLGLSDPDKE